MAPKVYCAPAATTLLILLSCGHTAVDDQHCLRPRQPSETCMPGSPLRAARQELLKFSYPTSSHQGFEQVVKHLALADDGQTSFARLSTILHLKPIL